MLLLVHPHFIFPVILRNTYYLTTITWEKEGNLREVKGLGGPLEHHPDPPWPFLHICVEDQIPPHLWASQGPLS